MSLSRRRFLTIASAACLTAVMAPAHAYRWTGSALGARAQILLDHPEAAAISKAARAEIARLERVFSLYQTDSELVRLNRAGHLAAPSFELIDCLAVARRVHSVTEGLFDPTVQPLWALMAETQAAGRSPTAAEYRAAHQAVGFDRVRFDNAEVRLAPGQALTLNGIAQGYIADRVAARMRAAGIADVLIDTGEIIAQGAPKGEAGWPVRLEGEASARRWRDRALATSATLGTVLDAAGRLGHILPPSGDRRMPPRQVSVSASSAALADALSTALCLMNEADARLALSKVKDTKLERFIEVQDQI